MIEKNPQTKECNELRVCAYFNWHGQFEKLCVRSEVIPIPANIVQYLQDEIIILPKECYASDENASTAFDNEDDDDALDTPVLLLIIYTIYDHANFGLVEYATFLLDVLIDSEIVEIGRIRFW